MPRSVTSGRERQRTTNKKPSLRLRPGKSTGPELRRIASRHLEWALLELRRGNLANEPVHQVRICIKKVRALLELAVPALSLREQSSLRTALGSAAAILSPLRDAEVVLQTLNALLKGKPLLSEAVGSLRGSFSKTVEQRRLLVRQKLPRLEHLLKDALRLVSEWSPENLDQDDLRRTLKRTYRRGRKALKSSSGSRDPDLFHVWRKRVKRLWYQLRITEKLLNDKGTRLIEAADRIGELAGMERDYSLLARELGKSKKGAPAGVQELILGNIARLQRSAERSGALLYAKTPRRFIASAGL